MLPQGEWDSLLWSSSFSCFSAASDIAERIEFGDSGHECCGRPPHSIANMYLRRGAACQPTRLLLLPFRRASEILEQ